MLKSKTDRIRQEFTDLKEKNPPLAALIEDLVDFVALNFNKDVMMTMIYRTQQEQWSLYKKTDGPKTKRTSPHMRWEAVDLRDWIYTDAEKAKIGAYLKQNYDATNSLARLPSKSRTSWLHAIKGGAPHFHVQYKGPLVYVFNQGSVIRGRPQMNSTATDKKVGLPVGK